MFLNMVAPSLHSEKRFWCTEAGGCAVKMFKEFFMLFSMMAIGLICNKKRWLTGAGTAGLGAFLINLAIPSLILSSTIALEFEGNILIEFVQMTIYSFLFYGIAAMLSRVYVRLRKFPQEMRGMLETMLFFTNNGFMGFPIAMAFWGEKGLLFMVANNLGGIILLWSYGIYRIKLSARVADSIRTEQPIRHRLFGFFRDVLNPNVITIFISLLIAVSGRGEDIPPFIVGLIESLGSLATPLSMIYVGASLDGLKFSTLLRDCLAVEGSFVKMFLLAPLMAFLAYIVGMPLLMCQIMIVSMMMPCAAVVPVMVGAYGIGVGTAARLLFLSTVCSVLTAPLAVWFALGIC